MSQKRPDKSVANLGAMVRQETGSLVGRKPIVMKSSFRISTTLGRRGETHPVWTRRGARLGEERRRGVKRCEEV